MQRRRLGLLALLSVARQRGLTRDKLIGYLWPDYDAERARHLLSDSVYRINRAVGGEALIAAGDELRLNPERLPCDAWEFANAIERRDWEHAVELHVAPFLDGFFVTDADDLERWVDAQRERLTRERARALEELAAAAERDDALPNAIHWWRELARHDPFSSRIALRLMRVLDDTGDRAAALQHARTHTLLLEQEMGLAPDTELVEFAAMLRARPGRGPAAFQQPPSHPSVDSPPATQSREAERGLPPVAASPTPAAHAATPRPRFPYRRGGRAAAVVATILVAAGVGAFVMSGRRVVADSDMFPTEEDISRQIASRLDGRGTEGDAARPNESGAAAPDPVAFNLYLKARYHWHRRTEQSLFAAADYFSQATARAPQYARAHAGLADVYAVLGFYDFMPPREAFPAAAAAARRALELDPSLGEPHATMGYVALYHDWDWVRAEDEFRRAIELEPDYSTAHQWYANFLTAMGRFDEAVGHMEKAMQLDPLSVIVIANAALGWVLYYARDYERAIEQCTRALELDPDFALAWLWRAMAHEQLGEMDLALRDFEQAVRLSGGSTLHSALHARALAFSGRRADALALLRQLEAREGTDYLPPYEMAKVHDALGDRRVALRSLERAYDHRSHSIAFLAVDPQLERLRSDPRFQELLRRAGLD
ncbi:MAG TPA: tetratricopeptide repeat protein [Longimicrobiales bacterium]|nr:tetratricopeptide repeat protein [Longimicrobiales bacterium]